MTADPRPEDTLVVAADQAGQRLDRLVAAIPSVGSRSRARTALETGKIALDGVVVGLAEAARSLPQGAVLRVSWNRPGSSAERVRGREAMLQAGVTVLYEDEAVIAVNKPPGLLTDAASEAQRKEEDTLRKRVRAYLGGEAHVVHRLDRDTSGVVLFARDLEAARRLDEQIERRAPERVYVALAVGLFPGEQGRFSDWMRWDGPARIQRACRPDAPGAVLASADWRVLERVREATLLEVRLITGRRNQIRLHLMLAGHPLVGERLYRGQEHPRGPLAPRHALHAARLGLLHPRGGAPLVVEAPLPEDMRQMIRAAGGGSGKTRSS